MTGAGKMPSSEVLKALRRLGGLGLEMSLERAVRIATGAFERGNLMPRSAAIDLGRLALDPNIVLSRTARIGAAKAVSASGELETVRRAVRVIGSDETPLDVLQAAAVILLGAPARRLSRKTASSLQRCVRRYGLIRGPIIDLVLLAARSGKLPSKGKK